MPIESMPAEVASTTFGIFVPFVVACASLIALLSVRNASISDRIRTANGELIKCQHNDPKRALNLMAQLAYFIPRYKRNNMGLIMAIAAFIIFMLMIGFHFIDQEREYAELFRFTILKTIHVHRIVHYIPFGLLLIGSSLLIGSLYIIYTEIRRSKYTLLLDVIYSINQSIKCNDFTLDRAARRDLVIDDPALKKIQKRFESFQPSKPEEKPSPLSSQ